MTDKFTHKISDAKTFCNIFTPDAIISTVSINANRICLADDFH